MDQVFKLYKRKLKNNLEPLLVMLVNKKSEMTYGQWNDFVSGTRERVLKNPTEFLGEDLPDTAMMEDIVSNIFQGVQTRYAQPKA